MDSNSLKFEPYHGDIGELYAGENYLVFRWKGPGKILASASRRGDASCAHLACDREGLRHLKQAVSDFVDFVFWLFDWCKMVIAQITRPSVERMVKKCGFMFIGEDAKGVKVYARYQ